MAFTLSSQEERDYPKEKERAVWKKVNADRYLRKIGQRMLQTTTPIGGFLPSKNLWTLEPFQAAKVSSTFGFIVGNTVLFNTSLVDFGELAENFCMTRNSDWEWICGAWKFGERQYRVRNLYMEALPYATSVATGDELRTFTNLWLRFPGFFTGVKLHRGSAYRQEVSLYCRKCPDARLQSVDLTDWLAGPKGKKRKCPS